MKNYTITVNGKAYAVTVEEGAVSGIAAAPAAPAAPAPAAAPAPTAAPAEEENLTDDTELVSVITAAIAAYEGKETVDNGLVVRSIKRVSNRNWN